MAMPLPDHGGCADPMAPRLFRVRRVRRETRDTVTVDLEPRDGEPLRFAPGQFTMLYVFGVGEVPISICGDPTAGDGPLAQTLRGVGAVTDAICRMKRGSTVGVRGPFGTAWPLPEAEGGDVLVIAGGLGLAPLRPAIYHLLAHRARYGRIALLCGARSPENLLFVRELERWRSRFDLQVHVTVDTAGPDWKGNVGVVTTLFPQIEFDPAETTALVCGPEVMMRYTAAELEKRGVAPGCIHLSIERNMKCAVGFCGHCQWGPTFVCKDGPVFQYAAIERWLRIKEL
jgi:NAD(P)H-flavin reductase